VARLQASSYALFDRLGAFPQIEALTSVGGGKTVTEREGGRSSSTRPSSIDPSFRCSNCRSRKARQATALPDTNSIVLTQSEAVRHFGTADVLGRTITLGAGEGKRDKRISGVLRDPPRDTSLKIGIVSLRDPAQTPPEMRGWGNFDQHHYVKLRDGADAAAINAALPAWESAPSPRS
jgi:putative ABC transport system permease protein